MRRSYGVTDDWVYIYIIWEGRVHWIICLPIVPKASIYVPKVMHKPVMGSNTMSETFTHIEILFRQPNLSCCSLCRWGKGLPILQYMPKGILLALNTMLHNKWSKCDLKRVEVPNLVQAAKLKLVLLIAVKGREMPIIPSIYAHFPLDLHGSQVQCCNKLRRIGGSTHHHILDE